MRTRVKLKPGQPGTKKHMDKYGDALVCVRYRYDTQKRKQYKTVEIIVSESDWTPPPAKYPDSTMVALKIGARETAMQSRVKSVGGRWNPDKKLWIVPYGCIRGTSLENFIIIETKDGASEDKNL